MGIAVMGAIMAHEVGELRGPAVFRQKEIFVDGFQTTLTVAALIAVLGAVVSLVLIRAHEREPAHEREGVPEVV
jgi:hypothetical protein